MNDLSGATLAASLPDKRQVAVSFSRAAASYDSVADLQRAVGHELIARLPANLSPQRWLDLGSGTGYFSRVLGQRFADGQGLALDIAQGMLAYARPLGGAQHFIAGDAESLPLQSNSCDVIFSSLALQWCADFRAVLSEAQRVLKTATTLVTQPSEQTHGVARARAGKIRAPPKSILDERSGVQAAKHAPAVSAALSELGIRKPALEYFRRVLSAYPGNAECRNNLAWILATATWGAPDPQEILQIALEARRLVGDEPALLDTLGVAYANAGDFAAARQSAEQALALTRFTGQEATDFYRNAHAPEFGDYGMLHVRYGKASRGGQLVSGVVSTMGSISTSSRSSPNMDLPSPGQPFNSGAQRTFTPGCRY